LDVQRAAGESGVGKTAPRGFQQRHAGRQSEAKRTPARFDPLDTFRRGRPGLIDVAHPSAGFDVVEIEQAPRLKLVAYQPFWNLAVARLWQRFPEIGRA